jgi:hypothetical protein
MRENARKRSNRQLQQFLMIFAQRKSEILQRTPQCQKTRQLQFIFWCLFTHLQLLLGYIKMRTATGAAERAGSYFLGEDERNGTRFG